MKLVINKAFFGKSNCLKATLNDAGEFYFHFGSPKKIQLNSEDSSWSWKKVKLNDNELADILLVLEGKKESIAFFHDFKGEKTQIWISKKDNFLFVKIKEVNKVLTEQEQIILRELLKYCLLRMNLDLS
ncbi:MAG: hypothetical protein WC758_00605 [Candidatus Woesearchaeota archaeon]|jgi:hypothetical protein